MSVIKVIVCTALLSMQVSSQPTVGKPKGMDTSKTSLTRVEKLTDPVQAVIRRLHRINPKEFTSTSQGLKSTPKKIADSLDEVAEESNDFKSSRMFMFPKATPFSDTKLPAAKHLRFTFSPGLLGKGSLQVAKLSLYVDGIAARNASHKAEMSAVERHGSKSTVVGSTDVFENGWTTINLFDRINLLMEQQLKGIEQDLNIDIECEKCGNGFHIVVEKLLEPYLELEFRKPTLLKRQKRSADCTSANDTCCRDVINVDLDNLGFDQVIFPRQFKAYHCRGDCISDKEDEITNSIQSAINLAPRQSCCAPKRTKPLSLLYASDGTIFQTKIRHFVVLECACT